MTTEFPVELAPAKSLGMFNSSFTAMAWVHSDASVSDDETVDYAIMGTNTFTLNKGLHILVSAWLVWGEYACTWCGVSMHAHPGECISLLSRVHLRVDITIACDT